MLHRKKGLPEESELLLCTISKIQLNSVFVDIDEYGIQGMIHISEIAPGRIRNIRDFVREGKKVVCVVLRVNKERGHVDLSLRRVNEAQKKRKVEYIKQEQRAEKIVEFVAQQCNLQTEAIYKELISKIENSYDGLVPFFNDIVNNVARMQDFVDAKYSKQLEEVIRQRIKPPEVEIEGEMSITCYESDGIEVIKKAFTNLDPQVILYYEGGGKYHLSLKSSNYKDAEAIMDKAVQSITSALEPKEALVAYTRLANKK